jgi:predicted nucleotidyltransferase
MERFRNFLKIFEALDDNNVEYVLVGGVAIIFQGLPRSTEDVDIFIRMDHANVEKLRKAFMSIYDDPCINEITFDELARYPVIRYGTPEGFYIDILAGLGEAFSFDDLEVETVEVQGVKVRVATPETLYRLKRHTLRPKDQQDALFLEKLIGRQRLKTKKGEGNSSN